MDLKKEIVNNRIKVCGLRIKELLRITSQTTNRHILSQNRTSLLLECYF